MLDLLFKYHGIDWGAMIATFFMLYYLGKSVSKLFLGKGFKSVDV